MSDDLKPKMALVRNEPNPGLRALFHCLGCGCAHQVVINVPDGWQWNGDYILPTFTPSILVTGGSENIRCHSFVTDGRMAFLSDSTHELSGSTVDLPSWPYYQVEAW